MREGDSAPLAGTDAFSYRCAWRSTAAAHGQEKPLTTFPQLKTGIVGLAGLEPAASSLSGIEG